MSANQDELTGKETFQLEFDQASRHWYIRTNQGKYWSLEAANGIQACSESRCAPTIDVVFVIVDLVVDLVVIVIFLMFIQKLF